MIRIFILALISLCFTTLSIYANCDLPTGGACSISDLKEKQAQTHSDKFFKENTKTKNIDAKDKSYLMEQERKLEKDKGFYNGLKNQKDMHEHVDLKKIYDTKSEN